MRCRYKCKMAKEQKKRAVPKNSSGKDNQTVTKLLIINVIINLINSLTNLVNEILKKL